MFRRQTFYDDYDRSGFYTFMGPFFAEKKYKKELPYMCNHDLKQWVVFFDKDGCVAAFYAYETIAELTCFSCEYITEAYRNTESWRYVVRDMKRISGEKKILSRDSFLLKVLQEEGFVSVGRKGSYEIMLWRRTYGY